MAVGDANSNDEVDFLLLLSKFDTDNGLDDDLDKRLFLFFGDDTDNGLFFDIIGNDDGQVLFNLLPFSLLLSSSWPPSLLRLPMVDIVVCRVVVDRMLLIRCCCCLRSADGVGCG